MGTVKIINHPPGTPLPEGHPFKQMRIFFGPKPVTSAEPDPNQVDKSIIPPTETEKK